MIALKLNSKQKEERNMSIPPPLQDFQTSASALGSNQSNSAVAIAKPGRDCYSQMPNAVVRYMTEFLHLREMTILTQVSRFNAACLRTFPVRQLQIPPRLFQNIFSEIHKFPQLQGVRIQFRAINTPDGYQIHPEDDVMIETQTISPSIRTVTIYSSFDHVPMPFLDCLLARTPQIKEFNFIDNIGSGSGNCYFPPQVLDKLSEEAGANLTHLETLNVSNSAVIPSGLLALLQSSSNYVSLNLEGQLLHDGHLRAITQNQGLTHLNLQNTHKVGEEKLNFQILRELHNLTHLATSNEMSEDELIAIIESNPNLQELDISGLSDLQSDRVLFKIAEKAPLLRSLILSNASKINKPAFKSLIDGCPNLIELKMPNISMLRKEDLSAEARAGDKITEEALMQALNTLKERGLIERLDLSDTVLTDDILDIIVSIPSITDLSIRTSSIPMLTKASLLKLQHLINLETLNLDGYYAVTEEVLAAVANHCSKLRNLHVNCWRCVDPTRRRMPTLQPIHTALQEGRLPDLKMVSCDDSGLNRDTITAFGDAFPKIEIR